MPLPHRSMPLQDAGPPPLQSAPRARSRFHDLLWMGGAVVIVVMGVFQVYDVLRRLEIVLDTEQSRLAGLVRALGEQTANVLQTADVLLREAADGGAEPARAAESAAMAARL